MNWPLHLFIRWNKSDLNHLDAVSLNSPDPAGCVDVMMQFFSWPRCCWFWSGLEERQTESPEGKDRCFHAASLRTVRFTRIVRQRSHSHPQGQTECLTDLRSDIMPSEKHLWATCLLALLSSLSDCSSSTVKCCSRSGHIYRPHESSCFKTGLYL